MMDWKNSILAFLAGLSLAIAARAEDDRTLDSILYAKNSKPNCIENDSTSPNAPLQNEVDYADSRSGLCFRRPRQNCSNERCECCCECCGPRWSITADALFLHRSATKSQRLLFDPLEEVDLLNSSDMSFSGQAGPRLSLIRHGSNGWDFEFNFFGINAWKASADFPESALPGGVGSLIVDDTMPLPVFNVGFEEYSRLYSTELNLRRPINNWLTTLAGFRCVDLSDYYRAHGTEAVVSSSFTHAINAHNHMYGFQMGDEALLFENAGRLRINSFAKIGIFYNDADQSSNLNIIDPDSFGDLSAAANGSRTSFMAEMGLIGSYKLCKRAVLRGGYQVMWIEGVALAPRQISVTNLGAGTAGVDTSTGLFYHGATAGLEVMW
jgi:hypothetical protein